MAHDYIWALQAFYGVFWATFFRPRIVVVLAIVQSTIFMTLFALFYRWAAIPALHVPRHHVRKLSLG